MLSSVKFCNHCGQPVERRVPAGDHLPRHVCTACGHVQYFNPRAIVGVIPEWQGRLLLCRRAIEPRLGFWTFPAGFLELNETPAAGAVREAREEAGIAVTDVELSSVISVPHVSQIYLIHRGRMTSEIHHATAESSETRLVSEDEIPWNEIAFPTIFEGLKRFLADRAAGRYPVHVLDLQWPKKP